MMAELRAEREQVTKQFSCWNAWLPKRFEEAVGEACEGASARRVAKQFGLPESTAFL